MYINPPWFTKKHPKHTKIGRFGKSGKLKCQCQMVGMRYVIVPREGIFKKTRRDGSELTFQPINNESFPRVQPVNPPNLLSAPRFAGGPWQVLNESLRTVVQYVIQANFATKFEHDSNKMSRMIQTILRKKYSSKNWKKYSNKTCKNASNKIGGWAVWRKQKTHQSVPEASSMWSPKYLKAFSPSVFVWQF